MWWRFKKPFYLLPAAKNAITSEKNSARGSRRKKNRKRTFLLTGHVNSNGNLIGFIDEPFCGWFFCVVASCVKLNELSPRIAVAAAPNVHDDVVSISAWYCFKHTRKRVLQLPRHEPPLGLSAEQHRSMLFTPLSLRNDFNLNSNNPEHVMCVICEWENRGEKKWKIAWVKHITRKLKYYAGNIPCDEFCAELIYFYNFVN